MSITQLMPVSQAFTVTQVRLSSRASIHSAHLCFCIPSSNMPNTVKLSQQLQTIAKRWPVDPFRPHLQLGAFLNSLAEHPQLTPQAVRAARALEENEFQRKVCRDFACLIGFLEGEHVPERRGGVLQLTTLVCLVPVDERNSETEIYAALLYEAGRGCGEECARDCQTMVEDILQHLVVVCVRSVQSVSILHGHDTLLRRVIVLREGVFHY